MSIKKENSGSKSSSKFQSCHSVRKGREIKIQLSCSHLLFADVLKEKKNKAF